MNVTEVVFSGFYKTQICGLYQYDYGQVLKFTDITLPSTYEVHFAQSGASTTVTVLGDENGVQIPDQYLLADLDIKAYIYLHEEETDGETVYQVLIPVIARPEPTDVEPTPVEQDIIAQTIAALNTAVTEADGYADDAEQSATEAQQYAQQAKESAESIDTSSFATKTDLRTVNDGLTNAINGLRNGFQEDMRTLKSEVVKHTVQTLTTAQKTQARANIGSASADDLTAEVSRAQSEEARIEGLIGNIKGIYWATYGTTTKAQIYEAIDNGLYPVVNYYDSESGVRMIAPLVYSWDQYEFYSVQEREVIWFRLGTSWTRGRLRDRSVKYESQSLTTSEKAQARTNIGAITASEAPVQSVNGQTGAVTIPTATTSASGLMSSQDKSRLDDLYADYSSALTALGV